jgi:hypothetical protein
MDKIICPEGSATAPVAPSGVPPDGIADGIGGTPQGVRRAAGHGRRDARATFPVVPAGKYGLGSGEFKNELAKLHFFEAISENNPKAEDTLLESGFNKIDRLIISKNGKQYLDCNVDNNGNVIANNQTEHDKRLKALSTATLANSLTPSPRREKNIANPTLPSVGNCRSATFSTEPEHRPPSP